MKTIKNLKLTLGLVFSIFFFSCQAQVENCDVKTLEKELLKRYEDEQTIREQVLPVLAEYQKTGEGAFTLVGLVNKQNAIDAKNQAFVKRVLDKCGWDNALSKAAHKAIFMIIHHADFEFMKEYTNLVKEKSELGLLEPDDYPMMLDRVLMNEGKHQIYGTQTFQGKGGKNYVWPIQDVKDLQKRRDSISLPSMEEYFKISKEAYNIEMLWDQNLSIEEAIEMKNKKQ